MSYFKANLFAILLVVMFFGGFAFVTKTYFIPAADNVGKGFDEQVKSAIKDAKDNSNVIPGTGT